MSHRRMQCWGRLGRLVTTSVALVTTTAVAPVALGGSQPASAATSSCGMSFGTPSVGWTGFRENGFYSPTIYVPTTPAAPGQACTTTISVTATVMTTTGISAGDVNGSGQSHDATLTYLPGQPGPGIVWSMDFPCAQPAGATFQLVVSSPTAVSGPAAPLGVLGACGGPPMGLTGFVPPASATLSGPITSYSDTAVGIAPTPGDRGYLLVNRDYIPHGFGDAARTQASPPFAGPDTTRSYDPAVGTVPASATDAASVWVVGADGAVYGTAPSLGSMAGAPLNSPVVGMATTPDDKGYWLASADGGVFAFGDASFYGSVPGALGPGRTLNQPVVGLASTQDGKGYWLVAADGGVFSFGDAPFQGSMGGEPLNQPVVGMAGNAGGGYWLVAADGGVFAFDAPFEGSLGGISLNAPVTAMATTSDGNGYWMVAHDGGVFAFGDAPFWGSALIH